MPLGTTHLLEGQLKLTDANIELRTPDGGRWRLHMSRRARELAGRTVRLQGTRVGFDELEVDWIGDA